jgi:hypothetical protein
MSLGASLGDRVELLGYLNAHLGVEPIKDHMGNLDGFKSKEAFK